MGVRVPYRADIRACVIRSTTGFTLVELMVVLVIVAMLASLTLAGLSGVRQRAKADKTRSTIRKIDSVIQPMYESYATRRVPAPVPPPPATPNPSTVATLRLQNLRLLMVVEMPDAWGDVRAPLPATANWAQNALYRRYATYKMGNPARTDQLGPAETLMMILAMSGFDPGCMEQFRADEIVDSDGDGAKEFGDGWGKPILFVRWPAGFVPPITVTPQPDPLDVMRVTGPPVDLALVPLILSAGPDEATNDLNGPSGYGISVGNPWLATLPIVSTCNGNNLGAVDPTNPTAVSDNITNYDLLKK